MNIRLSAFFVLVSLVLLCCSNEATADNPTEIAPAGYAFLFTPKYISADGSVVIGEDGFLDQYLWTSAGGFSPVAQADHTNVTLYGVSGDGSILVGTSNAAVTGLGTPTRGFIYQGNVWTDLDPLAATNRWSAAYDISTDGKVIVGADGPTADTLVAVRWIDSGAGWTAESLQQAGDGFTGASATAVNSDGSVIAGRAMKDGGYVVFRWTQGAGMESLGQADAAADISIVSDINADGSVIVGYTQYPDISLKAFRWKADAFELLASLPGSGDSEALAVSADGSVIVGRSSSKACLWTEGAVTSLVDALTAEGVDMAGWSLTRATGVTA